MGNIPLGDTPAEPKPGYKSTEFWVSIFTIGYMTAFGESANAEAIAGATAVAYALIRGYVKHNG